MSFILVILVAAVRLMQNGFQSMKDGLWKVEDRADKAGNKAEAMELRQMLTGVRGHEHARHLTQAIENFQPEIDRTYLLRHVADLVSAWFEFKGIELGPLSEAPLRYIIRVVYERHSSTQSWPQARARELTYEAFARGILQNWALAPKV